MHDYVDLCASVVYLFKQPRAVHSIVFRGELLHRDVVREIVTQVSLLLALFPLARVTALRTPTSRRRRRPPPAVRALGRGALPSGKAHRR